MNSHFPDAVLETAGIAHYFYLKNDEDKIILCYCENVDPQIQSGPECGIVALSMATQLLAPRCIDKNLIMREAKKRKFTKKGEIFSADNMAELAEAVCSCDALVVSDLQNQKRSIISHVLSGDPVLIPYDADHNHCPCTNKGRNAHWAVVVGIGVAVPKLNYFNLPTLPLFIPNAYFCNTSNVLSYLDIASSVYVFVRQGKTKRLDVWELEELLKSNYNMTEVSKKCDRHEMVLPEDDDVLSGLRDQAVLLFSPNSMQQVESEFFKSKIFIHIDKVPVLLSLKEKYLEQIEKSMQQIHNDTGANLSLVGFNGELKTNKNSERAYIFVEHTDMKLFQKAVISAAAFIDKINLEFTDWCNQHLPPPMISQVD